MDPISIRSSIFFQSSNLIYDLCLFPKKIDAKTTIIVRKITLFTQNKFFGGKHKTTPSFNDQKLTRTVPFGIYDTSSILEVHFLAVLVLAEHLLLLLLANSILYAGTSSCAAS